MERERWNLGAGLELGKEVESESFARVVVVEGRKVVEAEARGVVVVEVRRVVEVEARRVVVADTIEWEPAAG